MNNVSTFVTIVNMMQSASHSSMLEKDATEHKVVKIIDKQPDMLNEKDKDGRNIGIYAVINDCMIVAERVKVDERVSHERDNFGYNMFGYESMNERT